MYNSRAYCYNRDDLCEDDHCRCHDEPEEIELPTKFKINNLDTMPGIQLKPLKELPEHIREGVNQLWLENGTPENTGYLVYTYFDAIYTDYPLTDHLFAHECVHYDRQGNGEHKHQADRWWEKYLTDKEFRYQEELLAYQTQYKYFKKRNGRQKSFEFAKQLATQLSGKIYGNLCSFNQALQAITSN